MNRRVAVKNLVLASGGLITVPFWMEGCRTRDKHLYDTSFSPAEQATLAAITDTIIPAGNSAGNAASNPGSNSGGNAAGDSGDNMAGNTARLSTAVPIGARSVGVDKFLQKLIGDCYERPVQENVKKQLQALETSARERYGKSFAACTQPQRQKILLKLSVSQDKDEKDFFDLVKNETIRGFNTSQRVMEDYLNYKVAPGHYYGCVDIKV